MLELKHVLSCLHHVRDITDHSMASFQIEVHVEELCKKFHIAGGVTNPQPSTQ